MFSCRSYTPAAEYSWGPFRLDKIYLMTDHSSFGHRRYVQGKDDTDYVMSGKCLQENNIGLYGTTSYVSRKSETLIRPMKQCAPSDTANSLITMPFCTLVLVRSHYFHSSIMHISYVIIMYRVTIGTSSIDL